MSIKFEDFIVLFIFNFKYLLFFLLMSGCSLGLLIFKGGDLIVMGEMGEMGVIFSMDGVEEWELEKYLNVLER